MKSEPFFYEVFLENREVFNSLIQEACQSIEVDLVEINSFQAGKRRVFRIYIDKSGGVSIQDCAKLSRMLSESLDEDEEIIAGPYTLEVSSPGLDRPLKSTQDFIRNIEKNLRVTRSTGKPLTGLLKSVNEQSIVLQLLHNAEEVEVPRMEILSAKIDIQF